MNKSNWEIKHIVARFLVPTLALCSLIPLASGAESGTVDFLLSGVSTVSSVQIGDTVIAARGANGTVTVLHSSGEPFAEGTSALQQCATFTKKSARNFSAEAYCTVTFSPQDGLTFSFKRNEGDIVPGSSGKGVQQIENGTGRFAGVTGECVYNVNALPANWIVTLSQCKWKK